MVNKHFGRNQDRQQPYPPQAPEAAPAPAPVPAPVVFPSEHAAKSFEARMRQHYADVTADAAQQSGHAAALGARIEELTAANRLAEEEISERRKAIQWRCEQIDRMAQEKAENEVMARNNFDDAQGTAAVLTLHGFPVPPPSTAPPSDVLVAPVAGEGVDGSEQCKCGDAMVWDRTRNQYVHPLLDGGWELAGESCKRLREQTQVMPAADDVVVGS